MIKNMLGFILMFCQFYNNDNHKIDVTGFRLITPAWIVPYDLNLVENIGSLSSKCNCHCRFCYIDGNPFIESKSFILSEGEARLRIKYYDPQNKKGLFVLNREYLEPFTNPNVIKIFKLIREKYPNEFISMLTNGCFLTKEIIEELNTLKPIRVDISLNTCDRELRRYIMNDKNPEIVLKAFEYLRKKGIPFSGSIVAYRKMPLKKIEETILFLDKMEAECIRIVLPGFTKFHESELHFDSDEWWSKVADLVRELRRKVNTFIQLQPHAYWITTTKPYIDGIIKNSPAHRVGLKVEDLITKVDSVRVYNKEHARSLLQNSANRNASVEVERNGEILTYQLRDNFEIYEDFYPYKPKGYYPGYNYGIALVEGFKKEYLLYVAGLIRKYRPKRLIVFTSKLIRAQLEEELNRINKDFYFTNCEVKVRTISPKFWGGNIVIADLTMVSDYIREIGQLKKEGQLPDLVLIPSSFLVCWGRDYAGETFLNIQRKTGVRVELIPCHTINF